MTDPRKNFYQTLGVPETATGDEIKKAYRRLAKKNHPDVTGGDKVKESKFKEISEAYETLGDEKKRTEYDHARKNPFGAGRGPGGPGGFPGGFSGGGGGGQRVNVDLNDLFARANAGRRQARAEEPRESFGDIFGDLFGGFGGQAVREAPAQGRDVATHLEVDLGTAALGGDQAVMTPTGRITIKIPPGIEDGQTIRVTGKGEPAPAKPKGALPGDLLIEIKVRPHPLLRRKGFDLEVDVMVPLDVAILGGKVEVPTLEGKPVQLTMPAGTSSGVKMRLKGKGIPHRAATGSEPPRGDLYAVVQIAIPREVPERARELLTELAQLLKK